MVRPRLLFGLLLVLAGPALAQNYYDPVDPTSPERLRNSLHRLIDDHNYFPYTDAPEDTWSVLDEADIDPDDPTRIIDVYRNVSLARPARARSSVLTREHSWPKSYGFPHERQGGNASYPHTDLHALFLADRGHNSSRSNLPYRFCGWECTERPTEPNNGRGGGTGTYPGNSNWRTGEGPTGRWETWRDRRGDVARAQFYMDVRYEGGVHRSGDWEPDLILTDDASLIVSDSTENRRIAHAGMLSVLLRWHKDDPVDDFERRRNEAIYAVPGDPSQRQGNRNPFIDHPEWVQALYRLSYEIREVVDLGPNYIPKDINNRGEIVGYRLLPGFRRLGFIWRNGAATDIRSFDQQCPDTSANGINDNGDIVGESHILITEPSGPPQCYSHAFVMRDGSPMTDLLPTSGPGGTGRLNTSAWLINNAGVIIAGASGLPLRIESGSSTELAFSGFYSSATRINEQGDVVGQRVHPTSGTTVPVLWQRGQGPRFLTDPLSNLFSEALGLNDQGQVVGSSYQRTLPMQWWYGQPIPLDTRHVERADAMAVNNAGHIVGQRTLSAGLQSEAFFWSERTELLILNDLLPRGSPWRLLSAVDINDAGQIIGLGTHNGETRGFLLRLEQRISHVVNSAGDAPDQDVTDAHCDTGGAVVRDSETEPECTLRAAVMQVNHDAGRAHISFDIPAIPSTPRIVILTDLPAIEPAVIIDGASQRPSERIQVSGETSGTATRGLVLRGGASDIVNLSITDFSGHGLVIEGGGHNRVTGSYIGVAPDGTTAAGNAGCGIAIVNSSQNEIGGVAAAERNIISGNRFHGVCIQGGSDNQVIGNHVGTDVSGRHAVPNTLDGVNILAGSGNRIGAETGSSGVGAGNVISGNGRNGVTIEFEGERNQARGNLVGTAGDGTTSLANAEDGIAIAGADNIIGGASGPSRNVVSGNARHGIHIRGAGALRNRVEGNYIGVNRSGGTSLPNLGNGVMLADAATGNIVGGQLAGSTTLPGSPPGNVISGNGVDGVAVGRNEPQAGPADGNVILGNAIGMDPRGRLLVRNGRHGVHLGDRAQSTRIGGDGPRDRNVISGNDIGIFIGKDSLQDEVSFGNVVIGNIIGADPQGVCVRVSGSCVFGNRVGIQISDAGLIRIGGPVQTAGRAPGNQISNNALDGIQLQSRLDPRGSHSLAIDGNLVGTNGAGDGPVPNGRHGISIIGSGAEGTITLGDQGSRNVISGNVGHGILVGDPSRPAVGVVISDNFIGTDVTGQRIDADAIPDNQNELGNGGSGIHVESATGLVVGRPITSVRCSSGCNVISGNREWGIVVGGADTSTIDIAGNNIGTDVTGHLGLGNRLDGIFVTGRAREIDLSDNLVSGNGTAADLLLGNSGIAVDGPAGSQPEDIYIGRNVIGMNSADTLPLPNSGSGVFVGRAQRIEIEDNVISGNGRFGVHIRGASDVAVTANRIGREIRAVSNGAGVLIEGGASDIRVGGRGLPNPPLDPGERNDIRGGVFTRDSDANAVTVLGNNISVPAEWMTGLQDIDGVPTELSGERLLLPFDMGSDGVTCSARPGIGTDPFVPPPRLLRIQADGVEGIGLPNAIIEIFEAGRVGTERGRYFASAVSSRGFAVADADGRFTLAASFASGSMISAAQSINGRTSELSQLKRPVIFLPGAGGTELRRGASGIVWVPCCSEDEIHDRIDLLATNAAGEDVTGLQAHDVLTHLGATIPIIYSRALDWFAAPSQGYPSNPRNQDSLNIDLWRFVYDWRLDPAVAASQLLRLVDDVTTPDVPDRAESCEVDLVAHSLSGLIASIYIRDSGSRDHARDRVHRLVTIGTPYLGTPLAAEAQTDGYIFSLEQSSLYRVVLLFPEWGRIIAATRNLPVVYALMPSRAYWEATADPAYLHDTDRNLLTTFEETADFFTGSNILLGLGGNRALLDRMSTSVHELTDDWRDYEGPPHIFRIVGDLGPDSTVSRWNYTTWPNKTRTDVPNDSWRVADYRRHQRPQFTRGDGTVVLSSARLGRIPGAGTTDFSGVGRSDWIEEFQPTFPCNHTALAGDPEGCASLAEVMRILRSGYVVP